ncbi:hypothetical protein BT69DRAFT_1216637 [Atractiella rhizophila]|nr:hypothetical protein BT69DRAFT_1216637 [Atractiella rhizophila]
MLGAVECERKRITKEGEVKQKLSVAGVACNKCSICLSQFKPAELAYIVPGCFHIFHASCLNNSVRKGNHLCPVCRKDFLVD